MYCRQCGTQIPDDSVFCHLCGARMLRADTRREETTAPATPSTPEAAAAHTKRGYCERCGQELGVNEKMRGLSAHQECPTPAPQAPPEAVAAEEDPARPAPTAPVGAEEGTNREGTGAQVSPPAPEAAAADTRRGYCERCGKELGINEKMRGMTVHQECSTPAPQAPPSPARPSPPPMPTPRRGVVSAQPSARQPDEMFCHSCGAVVKREAELCVHCGVRVRRPVGQAAGAKSKVAAVLLAVFLGFWTWLYTYREDGWKFWVGLGVSIANFVLLIVTLGLWIFVWWIFGLGLWIWAIVDTAVKDDQWYLSY